MLFEDSIWTFSNIIVANKVLLHLTKQYCTLLYHRIALEWVWIMSSRFYRIYDNSCAFRLFRRPVLKVILLMQRPTGFNWKNSSQAEKSSDKNLMKGVKPVVSEKSKSYVQTLTNTGLLGLTLFQCKKLDPSLSIQLFSRSYMVSSEPLLERESSSYLRSNSSSKT